MFLHVFLSQPQNDDLSDNKQRCSKHPRYKGEFLGSIFLAKYGGKMTII